MNACSLNQTRVVHVLPDLLRSKRKTHWGGSRLTRQRAASCPQAHAAPSRKHSGRKPHGRRMHAVPGIHTSNDKFDGVVYEYFVRMLGLSKSFSDLEGQSACTVWPGPGKPQEEERGSTGRKYSSAGICAKHATLLAPRGHSARRRSILHTYGKNTNETAAALPADPGDDARHWRISGMARVYSRISTPKP